MTNTTTGGASKRRAVLRDRRGSATIEYALLAAMIAIAGAVGIAPFGNALAQELSALSLERLIEPQSAAAQQVCRRLEWSDAELRNLISKGAAKPD